MSDAMAGDAREGRGAIIRNHFILAPLQPLFAFIYCISSTARRTHAAEVFTINPGGRGSKYSFYLSLI